ncbi:MAG: hypothetical protein MZV65_36965 [Chromatiales bacterium]|nr:hypothetical protein [Chromatiales bacterium]
MDDIWAAPLFARTYSARTRRSRRASRRSGASRRARPRRTASYTVARVREEVSLVNGAKVSKQVNYTEQRTLPLAASEVKVKLGLDHRQRCWSSCVPVTRLTLAIRN